MVTFVEATFVLATLAHINNISVVTGLILTKLQTLKVRFWNLLLQMLTVMLTFVQVTFVLATFVHFSNISAVSGLILTKL